jgi:hypothetical protein
VTHCLISGPAGDSGDPEPTTTPFLRGRAPKSVLWTGLYSLQRYSPRGRRLLRNSLASSLEAQLIG